MTTEQQERKSAYKVGFLMKLAEAGVRPSAFYGAVKSAASLGDIPGLAVDAAKLSATAGLAAPLAVGGAAGVGKALLDAPTDRDMETLRQLEVEAMYRRMAEVVRARAQTKKVK